MDHGAFDQFAKSLSAADTRRGLVRRLAALPLGVTLTVLLGAVPGTAAKKTQTKDLERGSSPRRKRRKARHDPGKDKENRKGQRTGKAKGKGQRTKQHPPRGGAGRDTETRTPPPSPPGGCPDGAVTCGSECFPSCCPGATESCYSGPTGTANVGVCQAGVRECTNAGTWGPCAGEITPSAESCDGLDNDCDGVVDNGFNVQNDVNHCGSCGHVCPEGMECRQGVCKAVCSSEFTCDCSHLNNCSGNGCCTEFCSCTCDEGWTGVSCDIPTDLKTCPDFATCEECFEYIGEGCVWCDQTSDEVSGVCIVVTECLIPVETCPAGG